MDRTSANESSWCTIDECAESKLFGIIKKDDKSETRTNVTFHKSSYQTIHSTIALNFETRRRLSSPNEKLVTRVDMIERHEPILELTFVHLFATKGVKGESEIVAIF